MLQPNEIKRTATIPQADYNYLLKIVKWYDAIPNFELVEGASCVLHLPESFHEEVAEAYGSLLGTSLDEELNGPGGWEDDYYLEQLVIDEVAGVGIKMVAELEHNSDPDAPAVYIIIDPEA